jgi:pyruvate dehydrogenase E1 component beta subunit
MFAKTSRVANKSLLQKMVGRQFHSSQVLNEKMTVRESINSAMSDEIERD